jgi:hypothetical protein
MLERAARAVTPRSVLVGTLAGSLLLRLVLVQLGGQFFWPDELRYRDSRAAVAELADGNWRVALTRCATGDHPFFRVLGLIPATVEHVAGVEDSRIPAAFLATFSVMNVWLLALIARRMGASEWEAVLAAVAGATSNVLLYWARHISPYDASMTLLLTGLLLGVGSDRLRASAYCGVLAALGFLVYAGYWTLAAVVLAVHGWRSASLRVRSVRAAVASTAMASTLALVAGAGALLGIPLLARFLAFSKTVNQGLYSEGWSLPFEYFWEAERLVLVVWIAAAAACAWRTFRRRATERERVWLLGLVMVYAGLFVTSVVLHKFVVYGRLARQMVPFFGLLAANRLEALRTSRSPTVRLSFAAAVVGLVVQALFNFGGPLGHCFPLDFARDDSRRGNFGIRRRYGVVVAANAIKTHPLPAPVLLPARYVTLKEAPYPRNYRPYQYEGCTPAERAMIRSRAVRMRLLLALPAQR